MTSYRVTTERLVEANTPQEAAALSGRDAPDQWVVYGDDYREVTTVSPQDVVDVFDRWSEDVVEAEIVEDDDPNGTPTLTIRDWRGDVAATFDVDIDPGEYWGDPGK